MADDSRTRTADLRNGRRTDQENVHVASLRNGRGTGLRNVRGAVYLPQKDWNAYQMWANYRNTVVERDLGYAATLDLNSLRVFASYEHWREDGPAFFAHVEHFLSTCEVRGIRPIVVLFEAPPKAPPTEANLHATDPEKAFGVHSPSRQEVLQPRNWKGYARSPIHFARRWAQEYAEDDRLLATEIMNEPGNVQPRRDFVVDALRAVRDAAPNATLTIGTKDVRFAEVYDRELSRDGLRGLDAYQFHMNLPPNPRAARRYMNHQRALADDVSEGIVGEKKPLWCTEWQRTLEEPPSRFAPHLASLAPTITEARTDGPLDGDFFWSLMLRPAYLRVPRERGRVNGLFHSDGAVYSRTDAESIAVRSLDLSGRHALPSSWRTHSFPYPGSRSNGPAQASDPGDSGEAAHTDGSTDMYSKSDGFGVSSDFWGSLRERLHRMVRLIPTDE